MVEERRQQKGNVEMGTKSSKPAKQQKVPVSTTTNTRPAPPTSRPEPTVKVVEAVKTVAPPPVVGTLEHSFHQYSTLTAQDMGLENNKTSPYITGSGLSKFFEDIKVPLDSNDALIVCFMMKANTKPFTITEAEFMSLRSTLNLSSVQSIPSKLSEWRGNLDKKAFFTFCFMFFRDTEVATVLPVDTAVSVWQTILPVLYKNFPVQSLVAFSSTIYKKPITKDVWRGIYELIEKHPGGDFSTFDDSMAWPIFVDEYVAAVQEKKV
jgi:hypothetical protein